MIYCAEKSAICQTGQLLKVLFCLTDSQKTNLEQEVVSSKTVESFKKQTSHCP